MILFTVFVGLFVTINAQVYGGSFNPIPPEAFQSGVFSSDWGTNLANSIRDSTRNALESGGISSSFNPFPPGAFQDGVFSPDWGTNLANSIKDATRNALKNGGITSVNGITTVTMTIGDRMYTAQLPPHSSVSTQSTTTNINGQLVQKVTITVNGDVTVYTTINGRTTATDAFGKPRQDGGPFHIIQ